MKINKNLTVKFIIILLAIFFLILLKATIKQTIVIVILISTLTFNIDIGTLLVIGILSIVFGLTLFLIKKTNLAIDFLDYTFYIFFAAILTQFKDFLKGGGREEIIDQPHNSLRSILRGFKPYKYGIFPILVIGISYVIFFYLSPFIQPYIMEAFYTKKAVPAEKFEVVKEKSDENIKIKEEPMIKKTKSEFRIKVENGNGVDGAARATADLLNVRGYNVLDEDIANADRQDYEITEIHHKDGYEEETRRLGIDLEITSYQTSSILSDSSIYDFIIILGIGD